MQVQYFRFSSLDSTNEEARRLAKKQALEPGQAIVIVADTQTEGRGTHGRVWESISSGGLYYTLLFQNPAFNFEEVPRYIKEIALTVVRVIEAETGLKTEVEWPNDIILDQKKCGGILLETATQGQAKVPHYVMIGIGLNINQEAFSPALQPIALSLRQKTGLIYDKQLFINTLTKELIAWQYAAFEAQLR